MVKAYVWRNQGGKKTLINRREFFSLEVAAEWFDIVYGGWAEISYTALMLCTFEGE